MKKIENWENVQEPTKFKRLAPGGYICAIKDVKDVPEKEYLEIQFDIVKGDEKGYFQKQYDNDTRAVPMRIRAHLSLRASLLLLRSPIRTLLGIGMKAN